MNLIKIISYPNLANVEERFNAWSSSNKINISNINFSVSSHEDELWYSIIIIYEAVNEE
ncbi:MAG: hypothetical protein LBR56_06440 [Sporomusaceae bacterium]|jgi:hypothetical protein|nr:hypothetical protein [Sporomusaceae bacterium]